MRAQRLNLNKAQFVETVFSPWGKIYPTDRKTYDSHT